MKARFLSALCLFAAVAAMVSAGETDARLHADGKGWRLDKAKATDAARPRVLLIGDSILNGYLKQVTEALAGKAYVDAWVNPYNQSEHLNKLLAEVLSHGPYDVVHFNMGLHGWQKGRIKDGTFEPLTKAYVNVIRAKLPKAKIIWASSTPVTVKNKPLELDPEINPIIVEHNRLAANVMKELGVPVNDFYALLEKRLELARGDQFHWKPEAYQVLAKTVVASIQRELQAPATSTPRFKDGDVVCFLGDSITRGGWYHANIFQFYATRYPSLKLRFYNCGKSGDNAVGSLDRLTWDCLQHKPSVVVVMLGMNDAAVKGAQDRPIANLEKLVAALEAAGCRVIQAAPSIYDATVDVPAKTALGKNAGLAEYAERVGAMAEKRGHVFVDCYGLMQRINAEKQKESPQFTLVGPDRVHPGPVGHLLMAYAFLKAQGIGPDVARIGIDAAKGEASEPIDCTIEAIERDGDGLHFRCTERALPFVPDEKALPAFALVPFMDELNRETLVVKNLAPGNYELRIDDIAVGAYTADQLAAGVNLAGNSHTPQYQQALRIAKANARRHDIESVQLRGVAFVQGVLRKAKIDPNDQAAAEKYVRDYIEARKDKVGDFGKTMFERYLSSWGKSEAANVALIETLATQMQRDAEPVARQWVLKRVP